MRSLIHKDFVRRYAKATGMDLPPDCTVHLLGFVTEKTAAGHTAECDLWMESAGSSARLPSSCRADVSPAKRLPSPSSFEK